MAEGFEQQQRHIRVPRAKILVVDDVEVNLMIAEAVFLAFRVRPERAMSGQEALDKAAQKNYDLIFMDHMMPGMDGIEATKRLRGGGGYYATAPIVALTGNADDENDTDYKSQGFSGHIVKPLDADKLEEYLKRFLPPELIL